MSDTVVAIVGAFFVIGIIVGIITVVAMSVLRAGRRGDPGDPGASLDFRSHGPGAQPPYLLRDDAGPDDHPGWPGGLDSDFSGR